ANDLLGAAAKASTAQAPPPSMRPAGALPRINAGVRNTLACAVAIAWSLFAGAAGAQQSDVRDPGSPWLTNIFTPRATAMGGAHVAVVTGNDAIFMNPAGLPQADPTQEAAVQRLMQDFGVLARRGDFSWGAAVQNISTSNHPLFPLLAAGGLAWGNDAGSRLALDYRADFGESSRIKHKLAAG